VEQIERPKLLLLCREAVKIWLLTMPEINGIQFSLFWDRDRTALKTLSFPERVMWLEKRVDETLLKPLKALEKIESDTFVWLAITELVCAGIESLGKVTWCQAS